MRLKFNPGPGLGLISDERIDMKTNTRTQRVVRYREAYRDVEWNLCTAHAGDDGAEDREAAEVGSLGPVQVGDHYGICDVCCVMFCIQ